MNIQAQRQQRETENFSPRVSTYSCSTPNKLSSRGQGTTKGSRVSLYVQKGHFTPALGSRWALCLFLTIAPCTILNRRLIQEPSPVCRGTV